MRDEGLEHQVRQDIHLRQRVARLRVDDKRLGGLRLTRGGRGVKRHLRGAGEEEQIGSGQC